MLYSQQLAHPLLLAGVALGVTATALLATWIPVRRATRVEPTVALRNEMTGPASPDGARSAARGAHLLDAGVVEAHHRK